MKYADQNTSSRSTKPLILAIDDNLEIRRLLQLCLRDLFTILTASSVDEGLLLLKSQHPSLVFIDYEMPGKNGLEGIQEIRRHSREIPIVLLTGSATRELIQEALKDGANECLPKPFDMTVLKNVIRRHLDRVNAPQLKHVPYSDQDLQPYISY